MTAGENQNREIERKFLVKPHRVPLPEAGQHIVQGYLSLSPLRVVRVRLINGKGFLTIKGPPEGPEHFEWEREVEPEVARFMLKHLAIRPLIEKERYHIPFADHLWELDVFRGANEGLWLAEVELKRADEEVELPPWVGEEVTGDFRYLNISLVRWPYSVWGALPAVEAASPDTP